MYVRFKGYFWRVLKETSENIVIFTYLESPRGGISASLWEALQGEFSEGFSEASAGVSSTVLQGSAGFYGIFRGW